MTPPSPYAVRNDTLRELGYRSYAAYLASGLWLSIRRAAIRRRRSCAACPDRATEVHHLAYDRATLLGEQPAHLIGLCSKHHRAIEFTDAGAKRHLAAVNVMLRKLAGIAPEFQPQRNEHWREDLAKIADGSYYRTKLESGLTTSPPRRRSRGPGYERSYGAGTGPRLRRRPTNREER